MTEADIMDEIRDANLSYLMLAQNMIRQNRAATNYNKAGAQAKAHAAILMAGQPVEEIA